MLSSDHQLLLGGLERVVVVEDLPADELLELGRRAEVVDAELALDELGVRFSPLSRNAVDSQRLDLPCDVDRPVVHRVAEPWSRVTADDLAAALHHEPGHRPDGATDDDRAALLVDASACPDATLDDEIAATHRSAGQGATVLVDDDHAGHHVLARRPADSALDVDLRPVDQPAGEVAE